MNAQYLNILSIVMAVASAVLAVGDTIKDVPGIPRWLEHSWGLVLIIAGIVAKVGAILTHSQTATNTVSVASVAAQTGSTLPVQPAQNKTP